MINFFFNCHPSLTIIHCCFILFLSTNDDYSSVSFLGFTRAVGDVITDVYRDQKDFAAPVDFENVKIQLNALKFSFNLTFLDIVASTLHTLLDIANATRDVRALLAAAQKVGWRRFSLFAFCCLLFVVYYLLFAICYVI